MSNTVYHVGLVTFNTGPSRPLSPSVMAALVTLSCTLFAFVPGGRDTRTSISLSVSVLRKRLSVGLIALTNIEACAQEADAFAGTLLL